MIAFIGSMPQPKNGAEIWISCGMRNLDPKPQISGWRSAYLIEVICSSGHLSDLDIALRQLTETQHPFCVAVIAKDDSEHDVTTAEKLRFNSSNLSRKTVRTDNGRMWQADAERPINPQLKAPREGRLAQLRNALSTKGLAGPHLGSSYESSPNQWIKGEFQRRISSAQNTPNTKPQTSLEKVRSGIRNIFRD